MAEGTRLAVEAAVVGAESAEWEEADDRLERAGPQCPEEGMAVEDPKSRRGRAAAAPEGWSRIRTSAAETSISLKQPQKFNLLLRGQERVCRQSPKARSLGLG